MWIFLILLGLFLWFIIGPYLRVRRVMRNARRQANDFFGGSYSGSAGSRGSAPHQQPKKPHKKIDPNVGEYVEFEEIKVFTSSDTSTPPQPDFTPEPQIEDADWEELK